MAVPTLLQQLEVNIDRNNPFHLNVYKYLSYFDTLDNSLTSGSVNLDTITEKTSGAKTSLVSGLKVDNIYEYTSSAGITLNNDTLVSGTLTSTTTKSTTFDTNVATAKLTISGTTIAAGGSNSAVDVNINAKGAGLVYINTFWAVNSSGALVCATNNTYDIGNGAANPRDLNLGRNAIIAGVISNAAGAVGTPSYSFTGQLNMGLYKVSSVQLGISVSGALVGGFNASGLFTSNIQEQTTNTGITFNSTIIGAASTTSIASLNVIAGTAPTTPNDGDLWFVGNDLFRRISGATKKVTFA